MPIALAPLGLLPLSLWWTAAQVSPASGAWFYVHAWSAGTVARAAVPSRADLRLASPAIAVLLLVTASCLGVQSVGRDAGRALPTVEQAARANVQRHERRAGAHGVCIASEFFAGLCT